MVNAFKERIEELNAKLIEVEVQTKAQDFVLEQSELELHLHWSVEGSIQGYWKRQKVTFFCDLSSDDSFENCISEMNDFIKIPRYRKDSRGVRRIFMK
jgi:hypothetical protein